MSDNMVVYHGLNKEMMFERFIAHFNQPISTAETFDAAQKFGNPRDSLSSEDYRVWVLSVQFFGVNKTIWFISGDPRKAYSVMYPNFFRKPVSVVLDDLSPKNSSIGVWKEYVEHSNNNAYWSEPMEVEVRSHQLIY